MRGSKGLGSVRCCIKVTTAVRANYEVAVDSRAKATVSAQF